MSDARDLTPPEAKPLTPANQNPWYVLMTLYGEQEGIFGNRELLKKNRDAWNAWACQRMSEEERSAAAKSSGVQLHSLSLWERRGKEIERLHRAAWLMRNPEVLSYPGIPSVTETIDFKKCSFSNNIISRGFIFKEYVDFQSSVFLGDVNFRYATFLEVADFQEVTFRDFATFDFATFKSGAIFDKANFGRNSVYFRGVTFLSFADFSKAKFYGTTLFNSTRFDGLTYFQDATFGSVVVSNAISFRDCLFARPANFRAARFNVTYPDLEGTVLHAETTFTAEAGEVEGPFWPESPKDPKAAKDSCAKIRNNLGKQGFPEAEHFFYRKEMRFAGLAATNPFEKLAYGLFGLLSDYGYSFVRPLAALALVFGFGFLAHWGYFLGGAARAETGWTAFGISFANMFPYFGIGRYFDPKALQMLPTALKAIGAMQTVFGAVLLFLLALGLRTRFRMR